MRGFGYLIIATGIITGKPNSLNSKYRIHKKKAGPSLTLKYPDQRIFSFFCSFSWFFSMLWVDTFFGDLCDECRAYRYLTRCLPSPPTPHEDGLAVRLRPPSDPLSDKNRGLCRYRNTPTGRDSTGIDVLPGNREPVHVPVGPAFCVY